MKNWGVAQTQRDTGKALTGPEPEVWRRRLHLHREFGQNMPKCARTRDCRPEQYADRPDQGRLPDKSRGSDDMSKLARQYDELSRLARQFDGMSKLARQFDDI